MNTQLNRTGFSNFLFAWLVHILTASGLFLGLLTLYSIYHHNFVVALWLMAVTVFIDAIDGSLARLCRVKTHLPNIDGALLDNIVDFLNYVITPCFFLIVKPNMLPLHYEMFIVFAISMTSAYQFCQSDAKTADHFFKGFPCYWNIVIYYMFILDSEPLTNAWILSILCIFIFIPIKYVYPSRLDYLTHSRLLKSLMHSYSIIFGISSLIILYQFPTYDNPLLYLSVSYIIVYLGLSLFRTFYPLKELNP